MKVEKAEDLKNFPEADLVVNYIVDRWKRGLYTLVLVGGLPGSGKSSACIRLAEKVHEKINEENNFSPDDIKDSFLGMVKAVKEANPSKLNTTIIEEVSVLFPSRRAMSGDNVDVGKLLDTCRKKRIILFANAPVWPSIDSHMRSMGNIYIETIKPYKKAEIVYSKCYKLQTNPRTGKTYTHNFKRGKKDVNRMYTLMPSKEIWDAYENKKDSFLESLYEKAQAKALEKQKKEQKMIQKSKPVDVDSLTAREIYVYDKIYNKNQKKGSVAKDLDCSPSMITHILKQIEEKKDKIRGNTGNFNKIPDSAAN